MLPNNASAARTGEKPKAAKIRLRGGLVLNLRKDKDQYVLTLWRAGQHPRINEWNVIVSYWPYPIGLPTFHRGRSGDRWYLQGRVPTHAKVTGIQTFV